MNYSPKLRSAMAEIKEIIKKHDIGAIVVLHTPGFGEDYIKIDPSYSCAKVITNAKGENGVNITTKDLLKEQKQQVLTDTVNMFGIMCDLVGEKAMFVIDMMEELEKKLDIDHGDGTRTDSREIDN